MAVGEADKQTAQALLLARTGSDTGGAFNDVQIPGPRVVPPSPENDVPDPSTDEGRKLQQVVRAEDMATSVREITEVEDENGNLIKTVTMLDGSKQVVTEFSGLPYGRSYVEGTVEVRHFDKMEIWCLNLTRLKVAMGQKPRSFGGRMARRSRLRMGRTGHARVV